MPVGHPSKSLVNPASMLRVGGTSTASPTDYVAYWNLDEGSGTSAADSSGNGHTGTLVNTPAWTTGQVGSGAVTFVAASSRYISTTFDAFSSASAFSLLMWYKRTASGNISEIGQWKDNSNVVAIEVFSDGKVYFEVFNAGAQYGTAAFSSSDTNWNHFAMVFDGAGSGNSNRLKGYINGAGQTLTFTGTIASAMPSLAGTTFSIGKNFFATYSDGSYDDVRIYNRALSATEILDTYNNNAAGNP